MENKKINKEKSMKKIQTNSKKIQKIQKKFQKN